MKPTKIMAAFAVIMMMTVVAAPTVSAGDSVDLTATVLEPKPEIGIELNATALNFGALYPGNTSDPQDLKVTNIGLKEIDVTATASDDGTEPLFVPGLLIDNEVWSMYESTLAEDESDDLLLALHVPDDYGSRGDVSGGATFWAMEHSEATTVLWNGTVEMYEGWTFDFQALDGTYYSGLSMDNDMGALFLTGLPFVVSDQYYPSLLLESINGIANEPWSPSSYSWAIFVNDQPASYGLHDNVLVNGDNVKFYYLQWDPNTYEPMVDQARYVVDIDFVLHEAAPVADFTADVTSGPAPLTVQFTDLSTNDPTSWSWDFGDGATSEEQNPSHTYTVPGEYTVFLMATSAAGSSSAIKGGFVVEEGTSPVEHFAYTSDGSSITITGYTGPGGDVVIPSTIEGLPVVSIGDHSFRNNTSIASVTIPNGVTSIGNYVFRDCTSLTSITIPDSVTSIGDWTFRDCTSLTSITIPDSVTIINEGVFSGCTAMTSFIIPESVTIIGKGSFFNCDLLTSITIPDSVTIIGVEAFSYSGLTSITIPNSVTTIGNSAFAYCTSLTSITIPDSVTLIDEGAFYQCAALTSITLPNSVTTIGAWTFYYCAALTSITLPNSVTTIGSYAFTACTSLTSITLPDSVTLIDEGAFYQCAALTSITIGSGVTTIGNNAFNGCAALTSITIGSGVTTIGQEAFRNCAALTSVTIPDSVTSIGSHAFRGCAALTSVTIGSGVTSIGNYAFRDCTSLTSMTFEGNAPTVGSNWALNVPTTMTVYYHAGATGFTNPWQGFTTVQLP